MEFETVVKNRRSIRKYQDKKVEPEKIEKLIESVRLCQSAKNRQPWQLMILQDEGKDQVAQIMLDLFETNVYELPGYMNSSKYSAWTIKSAPLLILVFREKDEIWDLGDYVSIGAAIEHICLEAVNLDLGSVWIRDTAYTEKEICTYAGYPDLELVSTVAIGYPDEDPEARPRKAIDEIVIKKKN